MKRGCKGGFLMVELVVAIGIIGIVLVALMQVQSAFIKSKSLSVTKMKMTYLAVEGIEAVRRIRDKDGFSALLTAINTNTSKCIGITNNDWVFTDDSTCSSAYFYDTVGSNSEFLRSIVFDNGVEQDSSTGAVVKKGTGGTVDPDRLKVTVSVYFTTDPSEANSGNVPHVSIETYLTNYNQGAI